MSVYSGFSTRVQEAQYYKLVENLISLLQTRVLFCLKNYPRADDTNWLQKFNSVYNNMKTMEFHKYLEPKLSESCRGLANHFSIDFSLDSSLNYFNSTKPMPVRVNSSSKGFTTPRKKTVPVKPKIKSRMVKEKQSAGKLGMSHYYGRIMDNFLGAPSSVPPTKKSKVNLSMDSQDFWLLDDKITVIDNTNF